MPCQVHYFGKYKSLCTLQCFRYQKKQKKHEKMFSALEINWSEIIDMQCNCGLLWIFPPHFGRMFVFYFDSFFPFLYSGHGFLFIHDEIEGDANFHTQLYPKITAQRNAAPSEGHLRQWCLLCSKGRSLSYFWSANHKLSIRHFHHRWWIWPVVREVALH